MATCSGRRWRATGRRSCYEDNFGIWKLDVPTGRTNEIKIDITTDEKDNEAEIETVTNEVDAFDLSPSGRRAVISTRGQTPDDRDRPRRHHAGESRQDGVAQRRAEVVARRQVRRVSCRTRSGRDEVWISDPEGRTPKKITDLDNEKGTLVWSPDSKLLLYTAAD